MSGFVGAVNRFFNHPGIRKAWVKGRMWVAVAALVPLLRYADFRLLGVAFAVSLAGELIQLWCFASLDKRRTLAFNGLYKHVRNPMYLGRYLLAMGYLVLLFPAISIPVATVLYGFYMVNRVRREERALREVFGEPYEAYCRHVNRFWPSWRGMEGGTLWFWDWRLLRQNHGPANLAGMLLTYGVLLAWTLHAKRSA